VRAHDCRARAPKVYGMRLQDGVAWGRPACASTCVSKGWGVSTQLRTCACSRSCACACSCPSGCPIRPVHLLHGREACAKGVGQLGPGTGVLVGANQGTELVHHLRHKKESTDY
jgi:hypothetical protein